MSLLNTVGSALDYETGLSKRGQASLQFPAHKHKSKFIGDLQCPTPRTRSEGVAFLCKTELAVASNTSTS